MTQLLLSLGPLLLSAFGLDISGQICFDTQCFFFVFFSRSLGEVPPAAWPRPLWMRMSGRADADKDRETDNLYSEPVIPIRVLRSSSFTFSSFFSYEYQAILFPFSCQQTASKLSESLNQM